MLAQKERQVGTVMESDAVCFEEEKKARVSGRDWIIGGLRKVCI